MRFVLYAYGTHPLYGVGNYKMFSTPLTYHWMYTALTPSYNPGTMTYDSSRVIAFLVKLYEDDGGIVRSALHLNGHAPWDEQGIGVDHAELHLQGQLPAALHVMAMLINAGPFGAWMAAFGLPPGSGWRVRSLAQGGASNSLYLPGRSVRCWLHCLGRSAHPNNNRWNEGSASSGSGRRSNT